MDAQEVNALDTLAAAAVEGGHKQAPGAAGAMTKASPS